MTVCHRARDITVNCWDGDGTFCGVRARMLRAPVQVFLMRLCGGCAYGVLMYLVLWAKESETHGESLSDISLCS